MASDKIPFHTYVSSLEDDKLDNILDQFYKLRGLEKTTKLEQIFKQNNLNYDFLKNEKTILIKKLDQLIENFDYSIDPTISKTSISPKKAEQVDKPVTIDDLHEQRKLEIQSDAQSVLEKLITQFERPTQYVRELVQNSIDAECSQMSFDFKYNEKAQELELIMEDDGTGMTRPEIKKYLLNLFKSSKVDDSSKIGKFGIGFVSIFALDPEYITVETTSHNKTHLVQINSPRNGVGGRIIEKKTPNEHSGTVVTLHKKSIKRDYNTLKESLLAELMTSCAHIKKPLFFEGKKINKEFEIPDSIVNVRFGNRGIEGIIGLVHEDDESYGLYNNRLLIKNGERLITHEADDRVGRNFSFVISSKYLSPNLSRNDLIQDPKYDKIMKLLVKETDKLYLKIFEELETRLASGANPNGRKYGDTGYASETSLLWEQANYYIRVKLAEIKHENNYKMSTILRTKKPLSYLPEEILNRNIIPKANGEFTNISELLNAVKKQKKMYLDQGNGPITRRLEKDGIPVIQGSSYDIRIMEKQDDLSNGYMSILSLIGPCESATATFNIPTNISLSDLEDYEIKFITTARDYVQKTRLKRFVSSVSLGDFSNLSSKKNEPFIIPKSYDLKEGAGSKTLGGKQDRRSFFSSMRDTFSTRDQVILNIDHAYTKGLIELSQDPVNSDLAYWNLLELVGTEFSFNDREIIPKLINDYQSIVRSKK
jgi:arsenate reductase-like glutaredoxin family protein